MNIGLNFFDVVMEESRKPFEYGKQDCALYCANVYKKAFGIHLADNIVGTYNDRYHAARTIVKLGRWHGILSERKFRKLDSKYSVAPADVVICEKALGIWTGNKAVFAGGGYRTLDQIESAYTYTEGHKHA